LIFEKFLLTNIVGFAMIHRPVLCWYSSVGRAADL
jgi:hypothetical protein